MPKLLVRKKIYDVPQRILHWWIGLSTIALAITGLIASNTEPGAERAYYWILHMNAGKVLITGFVGRLFWGIAGSKHALFRSLIFMKQWLLVLRTRKPIAVDSDYGHNPQAAASYLGFYVLLFLLSISGLILSGSLHGVGPLANNLLDEVSSIDSVQSFHEIGFWFTAAFILVHIAAVIYHERHEEIPIAQSMISGFQYRTKKEMESEQSESFDRVA